MKWWKIFGLAGIAGVAGTGVLITRDQRTRRAYTPDEIRSRLHARVAQAQDPNRARSTPKKTQKRT